MEKQQIYWESLQAFNPHISAIVCFMVDGVAKLIFVSVAEEPEDSPALSL